MPSSGTPAAMASSSGALEAGPPQIRRRIPECADARQHDPRRPGKLGRLRHNPHRRARRLQRLVDVAQIAYAIVNYSNPQIVSLHAQPSPLYASVPFVLGTPCRRGSTCVAASSARPNALNSASAW